MQDSIKTLSLSSSENAYKHLQGLPLNLTKLDCNVETYDRLSTKYGLENITHLSLTNYPGKPTKFPPKLKELFIGGLELYPEDITCKLMRNFNDHIITYDTGFVYPHNNQSAYETGIEFNGRKLHFSFQIDDYYTDIIFVDGDNKKSKDRSSKSYNSCQSCF